MIYNVNIIVHYSYEVEADSLGSAEDKGLAAFYNDETVCGDVYGELYCIDSIDETGNVTDTTYYYG